MCVQIIFPLMSLVFVFVSDGIAGWTLFESNTEVNICVHRLLHTINSEGSQVQNSWGKNEVVDREIWIPCSGNKDYTAFGSRYLSPCRVHSCEDRRHNIPCEPCILLWERGEGVTVHIKAFDSMLIWNIWEHLQQKQHMRMENIKKIQEIICHQFNGRPGLSVP